MVLSPEQIALYRTDFLAFCKFMFKARKGVDMVEAPFHAMICEALERVVTGETTRLIINIPPRSGKTEIAVKMFMAWCLGNFPESETIHASYSKTLATSNTSETRDIIQHEAWQAVFGKANLRTDTNAKDHFIHQPLPYDNTLAPPLPKQPTQQSFDLQDVRVQRAQFPPKEPPLTPYVHPN